MKKQRLLYLDLIRAVALAKKACPQLRLAIAGDGKERKKLEALTKELGLADSVFFLGWVNDLDSFYGARLTSIRSRPCRRRFPMRCPRARAHIWPPSPRTLAVCRPSSSTV